MKIAIDARESGTSTGRYVDKLIEYLHKLKPAHEIIVLTKPARLEFMRALAPDFKIIKSDYKEFTFAEQLGLVRQLEDLRSDLVHFTMPQQPVLYSGRTITTIHDLTTARFPNPAKNRLVFKFKQVVYRSVIRRVARRSEKLIAISEYTKKDLVYFAKIDPAKVRVIYEAADKIEAEPETMPELVDKKFILFVGRPNPHKNLKRLIEAMAKVREAHPEIVLVLAGKIDENYKRLQKFSQQEDLTNQLYFTDFVSEPQLRWLYENALAYIFPSLSEGFGLPGLEAMCYCLPVISSNAACLPEIYKDAALYFDPLDTSDMAVKILKVASDEKLRRELAAKGTELVKTYSWKKMAAQTLAVYDEVLNS